MTVSTTTHINDTRQNGTQCNDPHCNNTQNNNNKLKGTQYNNTQHNGTVTIRTTKLSIIALASQLHMLCLLSHLTDISGYHYAEKLYPQCHYAECLGAV